MAAARFGHLACAALLAGLLFPTVSPAIAQRVGVNSAVNPDATGTPPGAESRRLVLGQEVLHDEHIITGPNGQTQILFLDESAMSVGPNSDMTIDNFVYDPKTGNGQLAMSATKGVLRFVGGRLSKNEEQVTLHTPVGTIGVRGGVFLANLTGAGKLDVVFLYGKGLTVTGNCGTGNCPSQTITRPNFSVSISGPGAAPSSPAPAPANSVATTLAQFNGQSGATGGSSSPPTDSTVANSGIGNTISGNVTASVQQAGQNAPAPAQAQGVNVGTVQSSLSVNTVSTQGSPVIVDAIDNPTPSGSPIGGVAISGGVKVAPSSNTGFNQSTQRFAFNGRINNGTATGSDANGTVFTLSPLVAGQTTNVTGTASTAAVPATGTAYLSADSRFFFANLTAQGGSGDKIFVFGGAPVDQSFFAATPNAQILAFNVQPDAALGGSAIQTIPFLPSFAGGTQANAVVSPLYVVTQPNKAFGAFNAASNPSGGAPRILQASLGINGQGASQTSALSILTGSFFTSNNTGTVAASGPIRGTYMTGGTSPLTHISSGFAPVQDANGNNLFGGTTIDGFVLDSSKYDANQNFVPDSANAFTIGPGSTSTLYGFNQPVLAGTVPTGVGIVRSALSEQGFFGGIMTNGRPFEYVLAGSTTLTTDPTGGTVFSLFSGTDPFTQSTNPGSGIQTLLLPFGTSSGRTYARSAFIDNNIFAAAESPTQGVQLVSPSGATFTYPTYVSGAATYPTLALVTSGAVPGAADSLFAAAGATMCACQYLQWGYWEANVPAINQGNATNSVQSSYINTWVAGQPTVTLPTVGTATYNGAAIGTIANNGANYLAAGTFSNVFTFGPNTGSIAINNMDGRSYSGTVSISGGNVYGGSLSQVAGPPGGVNGSAVGGFYGPNAAETGGFFFLKNTSGTNYLASGIFAGRQ